MKHDIAKKTHNQTVQSADSGEVETTAPTSITNPFLQNPFLKGSFIRFNYSYREISSSAGKTHIHHREHRFEDGKLSSEEFEGTLDGQVYEEAVRNAQNRVMDSVKANLKLFTSMLSPLSSKKD